MEHGQLVGILTEVDILRRIGRTDTTSVPECTEVIVSYP
jgi:CBS domain-containing protein